MSSWFDIDNAGWKRMNAGRPAYELVKELIQNVLDEDFNTVNIDYNYHNGVFNLSIEDDIQGGIANSSLITTVFMTGKEDSCTKRGRKGRGLKEFLSVCKSAIVETVGKTVEFCDNGTRFESTNNRTIGTKISCIIVEEKWNSIAVSEINKFLSRIIVYKGLIFVNGKIIENKSKIMDIDRCYLNTQVIENGIQKDINKDTTITIYNKISKDGWIYEMGIPVCTTDIPYDIDVHQRIPLNDNRNEVNIYYLKRVKEYIVAKMVNFLTKKDILGWASDGICCYNFSNSDSCKIVSLMLDEKDINETLIKGSNRHINDKARQKGFSLFDIKNLSGNLQTIFEKTLKTSDELIQTIEDNCKPIDVEPTIVELGFICEHKKLVKNALNKDIEFKIMEKGADLVTGKNTLATYSFENGFSVIRYNRLAIKSKIFEMPYCSEALDTLIHELGHIDSSEHEHDFINAVTKYSGRIVSYLYYKNMGIKKEEKKNSLKDDIKDVLKQSGFNYLSLPEIYSKLGISTINEKAGIRGILNRECSNNGIFVRHYDGAKYRLVDSLLID
ncbi:MAG: ATP-binding protein [Methanothrix sp.]|jgi:hypothetical protein|nr:ATP-binding protein [Methanothrix sp.]